MGEPPPKDQRLLSGKPTRIGKPYARRRTLIGCSLIGFGSSGAIFLMAAFMGSTLLALIGLALAAISAADIWQLSRS